MIQIKQLTAMVTTCDNCPYAHRSKAFKQEYQCLIALVSHKEMMVYSEPKDVTEHVLNRTLPKWCKLEDVKE